MIIETVPCSGGKLDGQRMTRKEIAVALGISRTHVSHSIRAGVFHDRTKPVRRYPINEQMLTLSEVMVLPDAAIVSRESMRKRLGRGIPYNKPTRKDAELREVDARIQRDENPNESRFVRIGDTQVVSSKHKHFCKGMAAFAALGVIRC